MCRVSLKIFPIRSYYLHYLDNVDYYPHLCCYCDGLEHDKCDEPFYKRIKSLRIVRIFHNGRAGGGRGTQHGGEPENGCAHPQQHWQWGLCKLWSIQRDIKGARNGYCVRCSFRKQLNQVDGSHFGRRWYQRHRSGRGVSRLLDIPRAFNPPRRD